MTERQRCQIKTFRVLQRFIAKLNESTKLLESERSGTSVGKKNVLIIGSEIWYVFVFS